MIQRQIAQDTCFDLYLLDVDFPFHFITGFQFFLAQHACLAKHLDYIRFQISIILQRNAVLAIQATAQGFFFPGIAISVSVKAYRFRFLDIVFQYLEDSCFLALSLSAQRIYIGLKLTKLISYGRIQGQHSRSAVGRRTQGTEFKTVSGKGKRRSTVAVGIIEQQFRNLSKAQMQTFLIIYFDCVFNRTVFKAIQNFRDLRTQESRDNSWRRFVGSQTVSVGSRGNRCLQ